MMALTADQIRGYASAAGFTGKDLDIAVGVALAESGGNPNAHNSVPPDNSYGLWQINMLGSLGPARRKQFGIDSNDKLFDPSVNAHAAFLIHKGSGWNAWTTYTSGKYKEHMSSGSDTTAPASSGGNPILGVGDAINAFGGTIFKGISNLAGILVAITLVVLGIVLLSRNLLPIGKASKLIKKVAS
jgi:hypothetical protein